MRPFSAAAGPRLVLAGAFLISFSGVYVKLAQVGPATAGFYRVLIGGLTLALAARWQKQRLWAGPAPLALALACGFFFWLDLTFWHRSVLYVGPGLATILANFQVFILGAVGALALREHPGARYWVSLALAMGGLFLLVGPETLSRGGLPAWGVGFGLGTAVVYTCFILGVRKISSLPGHTGGLAAMAVVSLATALFLGGELVVEGGSFALPTLRAGLWLLAYGVLSQALGWFLISEGLPFTPASRAGLILLLQPTLAFIWDIWFFARPTGVADLLGATAAVAAIYLGSPRPGRSRSPAQP
ncbi:MAG: DMT family transporter [Deltaproteobacteria bacterium]|nr:DMT family transporter [Deltaproteobacteria bacterium]